MPMFGRPMAPMAELANGPLVAEPLYVTRKSRSPPRLRPHEAGFRHRLSIRPDPLDAPSALAAPVRAEPLLRARDTALCTESETAAKHSSSPCRLGTRQTIAHLDVG